MRRPLIGIVGLVAALAVAPHALANAYTVTNTNSGLLGSLAQAISDANANPGPDVINFNIPPQLVYDIQACNLQITEQVTIDGKTQSGYGPAPVIVVDGQSCGGTDGIQVNGG